MSTASPLPLPTLPDPTFSLEEQSLRQQVTARLEQHRRRRPQAVSAQQTLSQLDPSQADQPLSRRRLPFSNKVADSVAARFAHSVSYRDFLAREAEVAMRQAEAAAEIARRNAEAIAAAQHRLLADIDQWNQAAAAEICVELAGPSAADVLPFAEAGTSTGHAGAPEIYTHSDAAPTLTSANVSAAPELTFAHAMADAITSAASTSGDLEFEPAAAEPTLAALLSQESLEPATGLPTNLIEFPRQLVAARKARPRLAEGPLREDADLSPERAQLRIFEVEPESFSTIPLANTESVLPEWSSICLDSWQAPHETAVPDAQVSLSMPLYTAAVSTRCMAAAVDACCLFAIFLVAVAAAGYASPILPTGLAALAAAGGSLALLGILYLLIFFTLTDATPGMRYARIALCTFTDDNPTRSAMRRRLLATALSAVPLGLGLVWAALDDDRLGWHDRISRTYQREY